MLAKYFIKLLSPSKTLHFFFKEMTFIQFKAYLASSINVSYKRNEQNHFCILGNKPRGKHIYWKHKNEFPPKQSDTWTSHVNKLIFIYLFLNCFLLEYSSLQCFVNFYCTAKWINHLYTYSLRTLNLTEFLL